MDTPITGQAPDTSKTAPTPDTATTDKPSTDQPITISQSDLDKLISKALKTRESNIKSEFEKKSLEEKQEFQKLYESEKQARRKLELSQQTLTKLSTRGLADLADIYDSDFSDIDNRVAVAERIEGLINSRVEAKLKTLATGKTPITGETKSTEEIPLDKMNPDQFKAWKQSKGYR